MKIEMDVSARMVYAAMLFVGDDMVRGTNIVHIEPHPTKGAIIVATDAHRMLVCHDEDGTCPRALALHVASPRVRTLAAGDYRLTADGTSVTVSRWYLDWVTASAFIRSRRMDVGVPPALNSRYLSSFSQAAARLEPDGKRLIRIVPMATEWLPAFILYPEINYAYGLIMPMQLELVPDCGLPAFMAPVFDARKKGEVSGSNGKTKSPGKASQRTGKNR